MARFRGRISDRNCLSVEIIVPNWLILSLDNPDEIWDKIQQRWQNGVNVSLTVKGEEYKSLMRMVERKWQMSHQRFFFGRI